MVPTSLEAAREVLVSVWGYPDFHIPQRRAVLAALTGRDCLVVLPTGGGKSLCYQVPALLLPNLTLVVSPLISLMQDQVHALRQRGVQAAYLSSTQTPSAQQGVRMALARHELRLLYVAPERLKQIADSPHPPISLLAVDEAHCISEWGHDFRPHYRSIGQYRWRLGRPPTIALTATATPATRTDIARMLGLRRPVLVTSSFDRPNLRFRVQPFREERARLHALRQLLRGLEGSAIVYLPTRSRTDGVATILTRWGFAAAPYHAGLPGDARKDLLGEFMQGRIRVMVATNAFGMGIDKPDVRLVAHLGVPPRPEAYYQEAGRAGRDGRPAQCVILWVPGDLTLARRMGLRTGKREKGGGKGKAEAANRAGQPAVQAAAFATMRTYLSARSCGRRILLEYLGERIDGCSGCNHCEPRLPRNVNFA